MNNECGCEGKAKLAPTLLQRQKRRTKQRRQWPSGICRPEPKELEASCREKCGIGAVHVSAADHEYDSRQKQAGCKSQADPRFCRSGSHVLHLGTRRRFSSHVARTPATTGPHSQGPSPVLKESTAKSRGNDRPEGVPPIERYTRQTTDFAVLRAPHATKSTVVIRSGISKSDMNEHGALADASSKVMIHPEQAAAHLLPRLGETDLSWFLFFAAENDYLF